MSDSAIWLVILFIVFLFLAKYLSTRGRKNATEDPAQFDKKRLYERLLTAQRFYLETLRREIANLIMKQNLETFEKAFYQMRDWEYQILQSDRGRQIAEKTVLQKKFSSLEDFDLVGTRHFVRYDAPSTWWGVDELVERYKELSKFLILDLALDERKREDRVYSEDEVRVFGDNIRASKDERLRNAMKEAMQRYYIWARDRERSEAYRDEDYEVMSLMGYPGREFTPEIEYGIFCSKLGEYGVYSFFVDDERDKTYHSYHRTNKGFSKDEVLMR